MELKITGEDLIRHFPISSCPDCYLCSVIRQRILEYDSLKLHAEAAEAKLAVIAAWNAAKGEKE